MTLFQAALLLFLVMDPFGNVPLFLSVLSPVAPERRRRVIARELVLALGFLLLFLLVGRYLLAAIGITEATLTVAGGVGDNSTLTDVADGGRRAISGLSDSGRSLVTLPAGFGADLESDEPALV